MVVRELRCAALLTALIAAGCAAQEGAQRGPLALSSPALAPPEEIFVAEAPPSPPAVVTIAHAADAPAIGGAASPAHAGMGALGERLDGGSALAGADDVRTGMAPTDPQELERMLAEIAARTAPLPPAAQPQLRAEPAPARVAPETKLAAVEAVESRAEADAPEAADAKPDSTWYDGYETAKSPIPPAPVNTPTLEQLLSVHCAAPERRRNITLVSCR